MNISGTLNKMKTACPAEGGMVAYDLVLNGEACLRLNDFIGKKVSLTFNNAIHCIHCGASTKKSFGQGACWACFNKRACNDICIMKPETCHYEKGTCREPTWAEKHCLTEQTLYLARSGSIKIGITRGGNHLIRWADQGASEGMIIGFFKNRLEVGRAEKALSSGGIGDRTSWHKMLKNDSTDQPFSEVLEKVYEILDPEQQKCLVANPRVLTLEYPHIQWPTKVISTRLDKKPSFFGTLTGIKGQYLLCGNQVLNIRSHAGYGVSFTVHE